MVVDSSKSLVPNYKATCCHVRKIGILNLPCELKDNFLKQDTTRFLPKFSHVTEHNHPWQTPVVDTLFFYFNKELTAEVDCRFLTSLLKT